MTPKEIRKKINENNEAIQSVIVSNQFTLNKAVTTLLEDNKRLQNLCEHEFDEEGICYWCDTRKEDII